MTLIDGGAPARDVVFLALDHRYSLERSNQLLRDTQEPFSEHLDFASSIDMKARESEDLVQKEVVLGSSLWYSTAPFLSLIESCSQPCIGVHGPVLQKLSSCTWSVLRCQRRF